MRLARVFLLLCLFAATPATLSQTRPAPQVDATILPDSNVREAYDYQLQPPPKGTPPWRWRLLRGSLPLGIELERNGMLAGAPLAPGRFHFTVEMTDTSAKPLSQTHDYVITVPPPLTVAWIQPPRVTAEGAISGELQVNNGTGRIIDLTVIVVAVNTIDKAFAIGYQHPSIGPGSLRVPFISTVPRDSYVVHADAVAEIAETGEIYRARLQTDPLLVP